MKSLGKIAMLLVFTGMGFLFFFSFGPPCVAGAVKAEKLPNVKSKECCMCESDQDCRVAGSHNGGEKDRGVGEGSVGDVKAVQTTCSRSHQGCAKLEINVCVTDDTANALDKDACDVANEEDLFKFLPPCTFPPGPQQIRKVTNNSNKAERRSALPPPPSWPLPCPSPKTTSNTPESPVATPCCFPPSLSTNSGAGGPGDDLLSGGDGDDSTRV